MKMSEEELYAVVDYRLRRALATLKEVEVVSSAKLWNLTVNRLYYAAYYACTAYLISIGIEASTHAGVIQMVGLHLARENKISKEQNHLLKKLFNMRRTGDYDDMQDWEEEEVMPLIAQTKSFIDTIASFLF